MDTIENLHENVEERSQVLLKIVNLISIKINPYFRKVFVQVNNKKRSNKIEQKMSICCDNAELLRKQREEIVLMTNELKEQEKQLSEFHQAAIKQKEVKKTMEKKQLELDKIIKALNSDIIQLKSILQNLIINLIEFNDF